MFSCRRAARIAFDSLERPLVLTERLRRFGHLLICRHCRIHDLQIRGLAHLFDQKRHEVEQQPDSRDALSEAARDRILAALAARFPVQ